MLIIFVVCSIYLVFWLKMWRHLVSKELRLSWGYQLPWQVQLCHYLYRKWYRIFSWILHLQWIAPLRRSMSKIWNDKLKSLYLANRSIEQVLSRWLGVGLAQSRPHLPILRQLVQKTHSYQSKRNYWLKPPWASTRYWKVYNLCLLWQM